jgi:hypothetical protein
MEHNTRHFLPVGAFAICVEQPKVRDKGLLVISGQCCRIRCSIGDRWIKWRLSHFAPAARLTAKQ